MLILAADEVEIYGNTIKGNKTGGLAVFNLGIGFATNEIDVGPNPEHVYAHDNIYENNGYDADPFVTNMLGRGFDIIWDTTRVAKNQLAPANLQSVLAIDEFRSGVGKLNVEDQERDQIRMEFGLFLFIMDQGE